MRNTRNYLVVHSVVDGPTVPPTPPTPPDPVTYDVTLPEGTGYTAAFVAGSSSPALEGSSVNFTVVPDDGHVITSVTDGTNTLTPVNGVYTINEIAADTIIAVEARLIPTPVTYTVTLPHGTGYTAAFVAGSSSPAVAGSVVNFTVVAEEGYEITEVSENKITLPPVNGVYTIHGIAANTTIGVRAALIPDPVAEFTYYHEADAVAPLEVTFTNASTDAVSYYWDFGDNSPADLTTNPIHTYATAGTYAVVLTAQNIAGDFDTETKHIIVS